MSGKHSFTITLSNNKTEKEGIRYLTGLRQGFFEVGKDDKKQILALLKIAPKFARAFDLIYIPKSKKIKLNNRLIHVRLKDLLLVELKTTKKYLPNNPKGFFFGATQSEFKFAKLAGDKFRFCFVSLHKRLNSHSLLTISQLGKIIRNKRIQYQINL